MKKRIGGGIIFLAVLVLLIGIFSFVICFKSIISVRNFEFDRTGINEVTASVKVSLDSTVSLTSDMSTALRNGSLTVREAKDSLYNVSDISIDTTSVIQSIASAMDFDIFGFRPLSEASEYFENVGNSVNALGGNITDIADNIDVNANDIDKIADDLESLSLSIKKISDNFTIASTTLPDFGIKKMLYVFLSFCSALSLAFILVGISLILINRRINLYLKAS